MTTQSRPDMIRQSAVSFLRLTIHSGTFLIRFI
jgi:hypothetical protein